MEMSKVSECHVSDMISIDGRTKMDKSLRFRPEPQGLRRTDKLIVVYLCSDAPYECALQSILAPCHIEYTRAALSINGQRGACAETRIETTP